MKKIDIDSFNNSVISAFMHNYNLLELENGRYDLNAGIYVNIETYCTQNEDLKKYESHKRFIDIQYIIRGEEIIDVTPITNLTICKTYNLHSDICFYSKSEPENRIHMKPGDALLLEPKDGHAPGISVNSVHSEIKKAVFKIPVKAHKKIKYLVMDIDGTLTDGKIYMSAVGEIMKAFNIKDGCGIHDRLPLSDIVPVIITGRISEIVKIRCTELGVSKLFQGVTDKVSVLMRLTNDLSEIAYIGDDINDINCMDLVKKAGGIVGCPKDAVNDIIGMADFVSEFDGGNGAVRDFIEWLLK